MRILVGYRVASGGFWRPVEVRRTPSAVKHHLFLPAENGAGLWSFCGRVRRDACDPLPRAHGFPYFGLCKACARTQLWQKRQPVYEVGGE